MTTKTTRTKKPAKKKGKKKMNMNDLQVLKDSYQKALREKGQEIMKDAIQTFFKANPKITGVAWTQYTPHFNDGDECHFGVNEPMFTLGEINRAEIPSYADDSDGTWFSRHAPEKYDLTSGYYAGKDWAIEHNASVDAALAATPDLASVLEKAVEDFRATVQIAPDDLFLAAFGDHQKVLLTPDEIYVEDFDHD